MMQTNINNFAEVQLTKHGFDIFLSIDVDGRMYKMDYDASTNVLRLPLWKFFKLFGKYIDNGKPILFENNSISIEND